MAILAGGAVAAAVMLTPAGLIEMAASSLGISGIIPAAAPPLGDTARLILAFASGVGAMALVMGLHAATLRLRRGAPPFIRLGYEIGYEEEDAGGPIFSRADSHPDAPPRRPIFASSDLGELASLAEADENPRLPAAPEVLPEVLAELELDSSMTMAQPPLPAEIPLAGITEMVDRFEQGMNRRRQLIANAVAAKKAQEADAQAKTAWLEPARISPSQPAQPARKGIDAEVDEALRAALGTLQKMTARAA